MSSSHDRRFRIDVFTPETMPMKRLAEYMVQFADLLGEPEHVHFVRVEPGSAVLRARVDASISATVDRRLTDASSGFGDPVALKAIDDMLANDNAVGQVLDDGDAEIIAFHGRNRPKLLEYGPFRQNTVLDGVVLKVGGKGRTVPIWLLDGKTVHKNCTARRALARDLAKHYDDGVVRLYGSANWVRLATGGWIIRSFEITSFEVLDNSPLSHVIERLHSVPGAEWGDNPFAALAELRASGDT